MRDAVGAARGRNGASSATSSASAWASRTATPRSAGSASKGRFDYSAIGSVVNLAARLCGEAQAGQILVDRKAFTAIEDVAEAERVGELTLKGFHRPVVAYNVKSLRA